MTMRQVWLGAAAVCGWALWAALGPGWLRIDHWAGLEIVHAGDPKGTLLKWGSHPIAGLALAGLVGGLACLLAAKAISELRGRTARAPRRQASAEIGVPV